MLQDPFLPLLSVFAPAVLRQENLKIYYHQAVPLGLPLAPIPPPPSMFKTCNMKKGKRDSALKSVFQEPQAADLTAVLVAPIPLLSYLYRKQKGVLVP